MTVHPGAGQREHTLVNALLHHCSTLSGIGGKERPGIVHRLDKETSGCLVAAKNDVAHRELSKQFTARTVEKIYLALVAGKLRKETGIIENKIGRHPVHRQRMSVSSPRGRAAKTEYRVLRSSEQASLVECKLHSGRTHQIRVHLHHLGNPVLGDKIYAPRLAKDFPRQMLHAWKLGFRHPRTGEWKHFEAPLPDDFNQAIAASRQLNENSSNRVRGKRCSIAFRCAIASPRHRAVYTVVARSYRLVVFALRHHRARQHRLHDFATLIGRHVAQANDPMARPGS